jgi:pilus assembly protein Flp/PilA
MAYSGQVVGRSTRLTADQVDPLRAAVQPRETTQMTSYQFLTSWLQSKVDSERGASLVEYALLVALIAVVCIIAITFLGESASGKLETVGDSINAA